MLNKTVFGERLDAFFLYVSQQPAEAASAALLAALEDESWRKAPLEWLQAANEVSTRWPAWEDARVIESLGGALSRRPATDRPEVHLLLPQLISVAT